jgi:hypothetical protein
MLLMLAGCGESGPVTYPVTGKVSYQGKPLPLGTMMFVSESSPPASATIEPDGSYHLEAAEGKYRVSVVAMPPQQGRPDPNVEGGFDTTGFPPVKPLVPSKFNDYNTSGVEVEVKGEGENKIDIELK